MAEDAAERRMERPLFGVSPPTPTASSAGPTLAVQGNYASIDWHGLAQKRPAISGTSAGPPRPAVSTSTAAVSGSSSHRHLCRPWDCGDLLRRLSTFRTSNWNAQVIGPAVCARKGWVNVDVDMIACEGCDTHLSFALPLQTEVEAASESFRKQLETSHQRSCPWKGNACSESLAQFPSSAMALIGGYNDRCDALLQLPSLPVVSTFAVDQMRLSRGPQIERLLSLPAMHFPERNGAGPLTDDFVKAQRIISFCGWEARLLPHAGDLEDYSAHSSRKPNKASASLKRAKRTMPRSDKEGDSRGARQTASTLLECVYCGASVPILRFQTVARPGGGSTGSEYPSSDNKSLPLVRGASAASSIDIYKRRQRLEGGEAGEATEQKPPSLSITAARASPTNLNVTPVARPEQQPEGSEMGDCGVASYESRGPRDDHQGTAAQGDSSTYVPQLRAESAGGTNGDFDNEDEGKNAAESSKRKRVPESLAADQHSLGMAVSGNAATCEQEGETEDRKNKKVCIGPATAIERTVSLEVPDNTYNRSARSLPVRQENLRRRVTREYPCSSSVNAIDTCFQNKMEDSMDSVEFAPQDDAQQHTAASGYTENEWLFDEPNSTVQGQQSNSYAPAAIQEQATGETNAAVISTGTATGCGGSVGMAGIRLGSQRVQSNEADIQGAELSELQTESVAGEPADAVVDAVVDQGDPGLVCDSTPLTAAQDCAGGGDESGESGSKASLRPRNGFSEERTIDTTNAVVTGCSIGTIAKEMTEGSVEVAAVGDNVRAVNVNSAPTVKEAEDTLFDPIRCHRSFCPWVNGLVLSAANGTFGPGPVYCGWQLTVDALDAFHQQENASAGVTESESTASMCKDDGRGRIFAQGSSSQPCNGSSRLEPN
ncbi:hypothetical protein SELMODRAFT_446472 [Selaginella moellendorffii]|uniref:C3HC-type domain-containing protein n=1 Tax=Selaginella moellendorffii TaxID=88036 RepID=D8SRR4_SELML|nr:uncharacterized protein LOC9639684 [Selaginella moellendorffii]EFJ12830.1 hypothetical protein SELMODRAFT_446472 [Selaginella moellendorffii]|eukprot:XP_002986011.1 uncharacterized protein LOC9639684 [Selaginella moellendorffii]